jgi:hypothetical protein
LEQRSFSVAEHYLAEVARIVSRVIRSAVRAI